MPGVERGFGDVEGQRQSRVLITHKARLSFGAGLIMPTMRAPLEILFMIASAEAGVKEQRAAQLKMIKTTVVNRQTS
jgi:hypothetical protein